MVELLAAPINLGGPVLGAGICLGLRPLVKQHRIVDNIKPATEIAI